MSERRVYWRLEWFDKQSGRSEGSVRLDTLTDLEAFDAFGQERDDPHAFDGPFDLGPRQSAVLQPHSEHRIEVDRYDYEFTRLVERPERGPSVAKP